MEGILPRGGVQPNIVLSCCTDGCSRSLAEIWTCVPDRSNGQVETSTLPYVKAASFLSVEGEQHILRHYTSPMWGIEFTG